MRGFMSNGRAVIALAVAVVLAVGCSDANGPSATMSVQLTDAPDTLLESTTVEIGRISLVTAGDQVISLTEAGGTYDLLTLQDGLTATMASLDIEPGTYLQLRLAVLAAEVTLKEGYLFTNGTRTFELQIPSGAKSGIKINLDNADGDPSPGIEVVSGANSLVIDFDVSQNFKLQGSPSDPGGIKGVTFTPLLRAVVGTASDTPVFGTISGTIVSETFAGVPGVTVEARLNRALDDVPATAVTDPSGNYTLQFLAPGQYVVQLIGVVTLDPPIFVDVGEGTDVTGVNFQVLGMMP